MSEKIDLRSILKQLEPKLYISLESSWTVAKSEWIPTLKMDSESHGGLPHLESVEKSMNLIAETCRPIWKRHGDIPFCFNAAEIYLALSAALFHDIGRGRKTDDHGETSREIIEKHWAQLGIHDGRIAHELALIAAYHTSKDPWKHHDVTMITPWGIVHTEAIASFLTLADELDTAYTRTAPRYMKDPELILNNPNEMIKHSKLDKMDDDFFSKGLYRDFISDVELDPSSHLLKTVLFNDQLPSPIDKHIKGNKESHAEQWLENIKKNSARRPVYKTNDYFFSYLEHLQKDTDSLTLEFMTHQYQKAINFDRVNLLNKLSVPKNYPATSNLRYNLNLWDRQRSVKLTEYSHYETQELSALANTKKLILDIFKEVVRRINSQKETGRNKDSQNPELFLNTKEINKICKLVEHHKKLTRQINQTQNEEHKNGLQKTKSKLYVLQTIRKRVIEKLLDKIGQEIQTEDIRSQISNNLFNEEEVEELERLLDFLNSTENDESDDKKKSNKTRHQLLIDLFQALSCIDINIYIKSNPTEVDEHLLIKTKETWSLKEYHNNLLMSFHIYLSLVRRLWKISNRIDFRYEGNGKSELLHRIDANEFVSFLSGFTELLTNNGISDSKLKDELKDEPKVASNCLDNIDDLINEHSKRPMNKGVYVIDFQFAVRFMFMQWLSRDIRDKKKTLKRIKPGLEKLEIPFSDWCIVHNNYLFDEKWNLCVEPTLSEETMEMLVNKVSHLSSNIHTDNPQVSWQSLAAEMRDPQVDRIRSATARLATLMKVIPKDEETTCEEQNDTGTERIQSKIQSKIHFGDVLLAQLNSDDNNKEMQLETSHSGWKLNNHTPNKITKLKMILKCVEYTNKNKMENKNV